jgi:hypothetical protein
MRKLEAILAKSRLTRAEIANPAFASEFFRPPPGELRLRWDELRAQRTAEPPRSQSLLLSYKQNVGGSIWLLDASEKYASDAELGWQARRTFDRVTLLVSRELPALIEVGARVPGWTIRRVHTAGEAVLEGESFGLSLCLAAAAYYLQLGSPSHVAAAACVASDGTVLPVDGLRDKLCVLHDWALGVTTVLTSAAQAAEAEAAAGELGATWRIIGVRSVGEAIGHAFPNWWTDLQSRWAGDRPLLTQLVRDLHRLARDGSNQLLGWRALAEVAEGVACRLPAGGPAWKEAQFAALIARRHEGEPALIPLDEGWFSTMRRPLRLRCLAHVVQSHGDSAETLNVEVMDEVIRALPQRSVDDSVDDLRLLGALGRTLAAFFCYEKAESLLRRAVQGWFELDRAPEASHALCELLRVVAVTNQRDEFPREVRIYVEPLLRDARTAEISRGFVRYWVGRGFSVLGDHDRAYEYLSGGGVDWNLMPDHLRACRLFWALRVARQLGRTGAARTHQEELQALASQRRVPRFTLALAELDRAQAESADLRPPLKALRESRPIDYNRFARASPVEVELCRRLIAEFRY